MAENPQTIELTCGQVAIVDEIDYLNLSRFKWHFCGGYAYRSVAGARISMADEIMQTPANQCVDHINTNKLDNRRNNLHLTTRSTNNQRGRKQNKSGFIGVYYHNQNDNYYAQIRLSGRSKHLGSFVRPEEAAKIYDTYALIEHGKTARTNFSND